MDEWGTPPGAVVITPSVAATASPRRRSRVTELGVGMMAVFVAAAGGVVVASRSTPAKHVSASVISDAVRKTVAAGSARTTATATVHAGGRTVPVTQTGVVDFRSGDSEQQISTSFGGQQIDETIRAVGGVEFAMIPMLPLPDNKRWVRITAQDLGLGSSGIGGGSQDPAQDLRLLGGVFGDATLRGTEMVNGVHESHYATALDLKDLFARIAKAEGRLSSGIGDVLKSMTSDALSHVPADVWLDDAGRVRRFDMKLHLEVAGHAVSETATTTYSDFGVPVNVAAPPPAEVAPFSALKSALAGLIP